MANGLLGRMEQWAAPMCRFRWLPVAESAPLSGLALSAVSDTAALHGRMASPPYGNGQMIVAEVMVPCFNFAPTCRLDWTAVSAIGGWAAAIATFLAVYVPARNYKVDNERRATRERQISFIEINRLLQKILDVRDQTKTIKNKILPEIPKALAAGADAKTVSGLLRVKGQVPFVILSDGLEMISIGVSNLQSSLDVLNAFLDAGEEIDMYGNHPFHRLSDYTTALDNVELAAQNVLLAIKKLTGIDLGGHEQGS